MSEFLANFLRDKAIDLAGLAPGQRAALIEQAMAQAEAQRDQNRVFAAELTRALAGNYEFALNERQDGTGFFYGCFWDDAEHSQRVDVMPPRPFWSGDFGIEAADATHWIVYLNGDEVQRSETIEGLSRIGVPL